MLGNAVRSNGGVEWSMREKTGKSGTCGRLSKSGRRFFEPGAYAPDGRFVFVRNPATEELIASYGLLAHALGPIAPMPVAISVYDRNPLAWWVLWRAADEARIAPRLVGVATYLPLNTDGLAALRNGAFNARDPDLCHVAAADEHPAALYLWGIVAHGLSDIAGKLVGHAIGLDLYETLPMIGTIGTEEGLAALRRSTKSASDAAELKIGSTFEIKLPPKHLAHQGEMEVWEGAR